MSFDILYNEIRQALPALELRQDEPMSRHCSFRIGGPAALFALPQSEQELIALCRLLREKGEKPFVMGNGTNLLVADEGLRRVVIQCAEGISAVRVEGEQIYAEAGATLAQTASAALQAGLGGMEFAAGIPGSLGGAVSMNAGAYGGEMKDIVAETRYLDENLQLQTLRGAAHEFAYRQSVFSDREVIILSTVLQLQAQDRDGISARMKELAAKRRASQPLESPSAGSTFKRPAGGFAAALIDEAGLKGFSVGGAQVSPKHAGFIINTGGATCDEVLRLIDHIQTTVFKRAGIFLEPEVKLVR